MMHITYPGRKAGAGQSQQILAQIPKCRLFIEAFGGSAHISSLIVQTGCSVIVNEIDAQVIKKFKYSKLVPGAIVMNGSYQGLLRISKPGTVVFLDPPYLKETRRDKRDIYRYDWCLADHQEFLKAVTRKNLPNIIISHYPCQMYDQALKGWRKITYQTMTRGGPAIEALYMNYQQPVMLQCPGQIGRNFTDRQRIKRKVARLITRLKNEPENERAAILTAVVDHFQYITR